MAENEQAYKFTAYSAATLVASSIERLFDTGEYPEDSFEVLSQTLRNQLNTLIIANDKEIKGQIKENSKGSYSIASWHNDHTITTIGNKLILSVLSTALVKGDFGIEEVID